SLHSVPQVEDARIAHQSETPALPWREPDWQHATDGTTPHAMLGQQTAEFLGPNKQAPVVRAAWRQAGEGFPKPDHQWTGQPSAIDRIVQEESPRFEHSSDLGYSPGQIREMLQHIGTPHNIEAGVGKGQGFGPTTRKDGLRMAVLARIAGRNVQRSTR